MKGHARAVTITMIAGMMVIAGTRAIAAEGPSLSVGLSSASVIGFHAIGIGGSLGVPIGSGWSLSGDGRLEFGNYREKQPGDTFEQRLTGFRVRAGLDRGVAVGPATLFIGSGFSFSGHKIKTEQTGFADDESEPYNVFGINSRLGSRMPLMADAGLSVFVQIENTLGWGSYDEAGFEVTQTDVMNSVQAGLAYTIVTH